MAPLKIYGVPKSGCVRRVACVCKLLNVEYEVLPVDVPGGEHKTAAFLEKHPFGQIPYIDDDGFMMYESRAISRYLVAKHAPGNSLVPLPTSLRAYALFEQACSIEHAQFDPYAFGITEEAAIKTWHGETTDPAVVAHLTGRLDEKIQGFERVLAGQKYLSGNDLTLADIFCLPYGTWMEPLGVKLLVDAKKFPNVARWWSDISSLPAWLAVKDGA